MTEKEKVQAEKKEEKPREIPPGLMARSASCEQTRPEEKGCYGFNGGVLVFVDWDGRLYVTPGTRLKMKLLEEAGLNDRRPKIEVPYSDGSVKSKRWLRKHLPPQEIKRSVEENLMPRREVKVFSAIKKVNRDGLTPVASDFIADRCARVKGKHYNNIGLIASYRKVLSFTDWEGSTYVTPYSGEKRIILERSGYVYVESMINVPYGMDSAENRMWLAGNIPLDEWERTEAEVKEERIYQVMEEARSKIEELGLKELPAELLEASAACEESYTEYSGMAGVHSGILSYTDPEGVTYVTPATTERVELLKSLGYQFMGAAIKVPHSLKTPKDINWLRENIDQKHWDAARDVNLKEEERLEREQEEKKKRELGLEDLPVEFINRTIKTEQKQPSYQGQYFVRNNILCFVDYTGFVYITPVLKSKVEILEQANYKPSPIGFSVPYSDGTEEEMEFIRRNLTQQELELTQEEIASIEEESREQDIKKLKDQLELKEIPTELLERSVQTEFKDLKLIGRYSSRGGTTFFVREDGHFYVTPTVPWKEKTLRDAGYREPEQLIRVPYGSGTEQDRLWLEQNLPPGEMEKSRQEIEELESRQEQEKLKKQLEERGIEEKIPEKLAERSAKTEEVNREQIGRYLVQEDYIGFVGPDGHIWITPNTQVKIELLKEANYQYVTQKINLPHTTSLEADEMWREDNLPKGEQERSRREVAAVEKEQEDHIASELTEERKIKELQEKFLERFICVETVAVEMVGYYLERFGMIYLVAPDRYLYITPSTPNKLKTIKEAGYQFPREIHPLPHCSDEETDLAWIRDNLPEGELERCRQELEDIEKTETDKKISERMEKFSLKPVPDSILERSADSGHLDPNNIGRLGIFRGVLAFVMPDERTFVAWFTEEKQEKLENCGYKLEGYMPIKVPYAVAEESQRQWLLDNLHEPDEEEELSVQENAG